MCNITITLLSFNINLSIKAIVLGKTQVLYSLLCMLLWACSGVKPVGFETPVDTTTKPIANQIRQTFKIESLGVYASNEFDGARLNGLEKKNDSTVLAIIQPENTPINNSPYYAFTIWGKQAMPLYVTFKYPEGFKHRYVPKIKNDGNWSIMDSTRIYKKDSIVTIKLDIDKTPMTIAAQEIQSTRDVKTWYTDLINGKNYIEEIVIGKTTLGRDIPVLDIDLPSQKKKKLVVLLTRQHPPEVTGYYAFQYFVKTILNESSISLEFLENHRVLAFPLMNPDGVDLGHWRHNAGGVDTNRDWSNYHQPEIKSVVKYIEKVKRKGNMEILIGLDFHSTWYDVFYTNKKREDTSNPTFIDEWFKALEKEIEGYKVNEKAGNSTKPVSKGWFLYGQNAVGITYEIGDSTPKENIEIIGRTSANEMMKILLNK